MNDQVESCRYLPCYMRPEATSASDSILDPFIDLEMLQNVVQYLLTRPDDVPTLTLHSCYLFNQEVFHRM